MFILTTFYLFFSGPWSYKSWPWGAQELERHRGNVDPGCLSSLFLYRWHLSYHVSWSVFPHHILCFLFLIWKVLNLIGNFIVQLLLHIFFHFHALHCLLSPPRNKMDDGKHVADLFFKGVVYGFNTLDLLPISSSIFVSEAGNIVVSEARRFD